MASSLLSALLSRSLTAVWISGEVMVDLLLWWVILLSLAKILVDKRDHDAHGLGGYTSVRVHLL